MGCYCNVYFASCCVTLVSFLETWNLRLLLVASCVLDGKITDIISAVKMRGQSYCSHVVPSHLIWLHEGNLPAVHKHLNQRLSEEDSLKCWSYSNCCCCSERRVSQSLHFIWNTRDVLIVVLASIQHIY